LNKFIFIIINISIHILFKFLLKII
jgi:hypothetical protein